MPSYSLYKRNLTEGYPFHFCNTIGTLPLLFLKFTHQPKKKKIHPTLTYSQPIRDVTEKKGYR